MVRFIRTDYCGLLSCLIVIAGCALSADRGEPTQAVVVSNPLRTPRAADSEPLASSPTTAKTLQVAYEAPAESPPAPPKPSVGLAPLSEGVPTSLIQPAPLPGQLAQRVALPRGEASEGISSQCSLSFRRSDRPIHRPGRIVRGATGG